MAGQLENLDTAEPLAQRVERHAFDRLIMLADGVFAFAVTLSALEIRAPADWDGTVADFVARMATPMGVYAISFAVVGVFWMANRRSMSRVARVDPVFTVLMLIFLALIALVPAGNRFLLEAHGPGATTAFFTYLGLILLLSLMHGTMWAYAAFTGRLLLPEVTFRFKLAHLVLTGVTPPLGYLLAIGLSKTRDATWLACAAGLAALLAGRRVLVRWAAA